MMINLWILEFWIKENQVLGQNLRPQGLQGSHKVIDHPILLGGIQLWTIPNMFFSEMLAGKQFTEKYEAVFLINNKL